MEGGAAQAAFTSGQVTLPNSIAVSLRGPRGTVEVASAKRVSQAINEGYRFATLQDREDQVARRNNAFLIAASACLFIPSMMYAIYRWGLWLIGGGRRAGFGSHRPT
jgi:hypothetical protein